ncbi:MULTISPECIES: thiolase family protein [unclassified Lactococcus]|uniref:thiolase family protein n=1 Tax=unclassified Lactococcus TaxID=2643510 RepID=UPI0011CBB612|nr:MULTISPECIES: thiolase family protein [unclassified Lactococcus]MQW23203.1 acetyl-CoA C-acyltransferase [Lactococcus sp. dk101]TXK44262.1 thiolase family protein [Lactococcus sp. dk310]TXK49993.1 thiolase family protein [Lactococcus sp. dk322]
MNETVILDSCRTPMGKYNGILSDYSSSQLASQLAKQLLEKNPVAKAAVDQVIFGSVITAGQGQNIARQISIKAGLPVEVPAMSINEVCGSGMKSAILANQSILLGESQVALVGGVEIMSKTPNVSTDKNNQELSAMTKDGLLDAFSEQLMGNTVEVIANQYGITREAMDAFAYASHQKALQARAAGKFDAEIVSIDQAVEDQCPRPDTSLEKLSTLRTVYQENGKLTAGNSSPVSDGASAILLASSEFAAQNNLAVLSIMKATAEVGVEPENMGISPIKAINKLLKKVNLSVDDIDLFEINEAFAASSLVIEQELGLSSDKVNIYGGAIALGHPLGSTGARMLGTLSHQLNQENKRYGVASLCIGGGLGLAVLLENPNVI